MQLNRSIISHVKKGNENAFGTVSHRFAVTPTPPGVDPELTMNEFEQQLETAAPNTAQ